MKYRYADKIDRKMRIVILITKSLFCPIKLKFESLYKYEFSMENIFLYRMHMSWYYEQDIENKLIAVQIKELERYEC